MLNALLINIYITLAITAVYYHFYRIKGECFERRPLLSRAVFGIINGLIGFHLMVNSVTVAPGIIIDLRNFMVILSAIGGGPIAAIVTAIVMGSLRILVWGYSPISLLALSTLLILALGASYASRQNISFKSKWLRCFFWNFTVGVVAVSWVLHSSPNYFKVIAAFSLATIALSYYLYWLISYYMDFHQNYMRITKETTMDFLTGLNNVRGFDVEFNKAINRISRKGERLAFLQIDIDFFKKINDSYGHATGDVVLKKFAELLVEACRSFDIISRNGGEEFSVILQDCPAVHAVEVAERIRKLIETTPFPISDKMSVHITASIGISAYPDYATNPELLIGLADRALYQAKQGGRNKVVLYEDPTPES